MSKIVIEFNANYYPLPGPPKGFVNLVEIIEELLGLECPQIYRIYVIDEDHDEIIIGSA